MKHVGQGFQVNLLRNVLEHLDLARHLTADRKTEEFVDRARTRRPPEHLRRQNH